MNPQVDKIISVIRSCDTLSQMKTAYEWAERVLDFNAQWADEGLIYTIDLAIKRQTDKIKSLKQPSATMEI